MAGHAPGPWAVQRIDYLRGLDVSFEVRHYWSPDQPQHKVVAATHMEELRRDFWKVDEANVRLIAAAPCLLEALIGMLAYAEKEAGCIASDEHLDLQDAAKAAIAKATQP
jgi:hypothetical protein